MPGDEREHRDTLRACDESSSSSVDHPASVSLEPYRIGDLQSDMDGPFVESPVLSPRLGPVPDLIFSQVNHRYVPGVATASTRRV